MNNYKAKTGFLEKKSLEYSKENPSKHRCWVNNLGYETASSRKASVQNQRKTQISKTKKKTNKKNKTKKQQQKQAKTKKRGIQPFF